MSSERAAFAAEVAQVEQWFKVCIFYFSIISYETVLNRIQSPRFARVKRPYTAEQVVSKRGTIPIQYPAGILGQKAWKLFDQRFKNGTPSHTYGALVH